MDAYKKYRQGLERAVQKLKEEREKQTTMEEMPRATRIKRKLEGRLPVASESGGESNRGPTRWQWRGPPPNRLRGWPPSAAQTERRDYREGQPGQGSETWRPA